ncbi:signal peptidase I [Halobacterium hubeiense]|uniref:Signal peptidase I n=2 Tax=Halobacterium TaxID=2239 RepID=A0A0U5CUZ1_9EURY|nr:MULTISPECIES: S26 family signal peptidase [Halobacterium]MCG1004232.1 S26 family signal peptidase [Halobacterium noricense]CQH43762.1 signal peptidase I [Halobacterium hubeiense]
MTNGDDVPDPRGGPRAALVWFLRTDHGAVMFVREAASSALTVAMVGLLLFSVSGVWPPLVAVESGSMQPNMERGDLVFVMEEQRFAPEYATGDTGVVTHQDATDHGYRQFGGLGDVVVYQPYGNARETPVIHRARFWVDDGENWYSKADPEYVDADNCEELRNCPAPHAGFITKGDNSVTNDYYDQTRGISSPVKPAWVKGTAEYRIPYLGWVRLTFAGTLTPGTTSADVASAGASGGGPAAIGADSTAENGSGVALAPVT